MPIIFFVSLENENVHAIGYHVNSLNYTKAPPGRIHIVKFTNSFYPQKGYGYYLDFHFHKMIRHYLHKKKIRLQYILHTLEEKIKFPTDITKYIIQYVTTTYVD
jgi:hypothetical protein